MLLVLSVRTGLRPPGGPIRSHAAPGAPGGPGTVGWARRGPTGTIGTNRPDGFLIAEHIAADLPDASGKAGRAGLDSLLGDRKVDVVTFRDWQKIEAAEIARARNGAPREKFTSIEEMLGARG